MVVSALMVYVVIGLIDFMIIKKKLCKKELVLYVLLYILFVFLCIFTYLDLIPHRFAYITKIW